VGKKIVNSSNMWRGMICLSLAVGFEEDRARLGLPAAVDRLRDALSYNGLTLDGDDLLMAQALTGEVSGVQLAEALCSMQRMGLRATAH
jgi:hypothetical protein